MTSRSSVVVVTRAPWNPGPPPEAPSSAAWRSPAASAAVVGLRENLTVLGPSAPTVNVRAEPLATTGKADSGPETSPETGNDVRPSGRVIRIWVGVAVEYS